MKLCKYLGERLNTQNTRLKLEKECVNIDEEDDRLVLSIPSGPKVVEEMNHSDITNDRYTDVLQIFRRRYGMLTPFVTKMPNIVARQVDGGDDFKRDFIIYITSSLINCPVTRRCRYRLMKILFDTSDITNYN